VGRGSLYGYFNKFPLETCEKLIGVIPVPRDILKKTKLLHINRSRDGKRKWHYMTHTNSVPYNIKLKEFWEKKWQTIEKLYL
jgi:hypothetical protein